MTNLYRHLEAAAEACRRAGHLGADSPRECCFRRFVFERGRAFDPETLSEGERTWLSQRIAGARTDATRCYENAQELAMREASAGRLTYVEGYVLYANGLPLDALRHAWVLLDGQKVIDITQPTPALGVWVDGREYFGVCFATDGFATVVAKLGAGSLIELALRGELSP